MLQEKKNPQANIFYEQKCKSPQKKKNTSKLKVAIYKKKESCTVAKSHPSGAKLVECVKAN